MSTGKPKIRDASDGDGRRFKRRNESAIRVGTSEKGKAEFQAAEKIFVS